MANENEVWKDVPGYDGIYQVSDNGNLKNIITGKLRKMYSDNSGRTRVQLCKNGKIKTMSIHRLVLLAFVGESDLQVDHINNNEKDNRLVNLRYCTHLENNTIYKHAVSKSGVRNVSYDINKNNYFFEITINGIKYKSIRKKHIGDVYLEYLKLKSTLSKKFPERFLNHPFDLLMINNPLKPARKGER